MCALVLPKIPDAKASTAVAGYQLPLIWMNDNIIYRRDVGKDILNGSAVSVVSLDASGPRIPDLDSAVLGASNHPFTLAMKCYASDVPRMAIECDHRTWVCGAYVI